MAVRSGHKARRNVLPRCAHCSLLIFCFLSFFFCGVWQSRVVKDGHRPGSVGAASFAVSRKVQYPLLAAELCVSKAGLRLFVFCMLLMGNCRDTTSRFWVHFLFCVFSQEYLGILLGNVHTFLLRSRALTQFGSMLLFGGRFYRNLTAMRCCGATEISRLLTYCSQCFVGCSIAELWSRRNCLTVDVRRLLYDTCR